MATKDDYRVTKDTSARKNTASSTAMQDPKTLANLAAEEASRKAYIDTLTLAYEKQIEQVKAESQREIEKMKGQVEELREAYEVNCAAKKAETEDHARKDIAALNMEKAHLEAALKKALEDQVDAGDRAASKVMALEDRIEQLETTHRDQLGRLQKIREANAGLLAQDHREELQALHARHKKETAKLHDERKKEVATLKKEFGLRKDSLVAVVFRRTPSKANVKDRRIVRCMGDTLADVWKDFQKEINKTDVGFRFTWNLSGRDLKNPRHTLQDIKFTTGDVICYTVDWKPNVQDGSEGQNGTSVADLLKRGKS